MGAKRVLVASPRGFCAGVCRAVDTVEAALREYTPPIYCFHEIVHNRQVVDSLAAKGIVFVDDLDAVPDGGVLLFSAHGVAPALRDAVRQRGLHVVDATCPFVSKVHVEVKRYAENGYTILLIGKRGHDEVVGVAGEAPDQLIVIENEREAREVTVPDPECVAVVMQTTLSYAEAGSVLTVLRERFPSLVTPAHRDICYATTNRQDAVRQLALSCELVLVLGARNSANSNRLVEVARAAGTEALLVPYISAFAEIDLKLIETVGVTAGASTPESFVDEVLLELERLRFARVDLPAVAQEDITLPPVSLP